MKTATRFAVVALTLACMAAVPTMRVYGQAAAAGAAPAVVEAPKPGADGKYGTANWTRDQDHANMLQQLGITKLRPEIIFNDGLPNSANYDDAKANPYPKLPDPLVMNNGQKVTTAEQWRNQRRAEVVEGVEREIYGRVPKNVPGVKWDVTDTREGLVGQTPVVQRTLVGHVDNSSYPAITVDIQAVLTLPKNAKGPVPVMIMFGTQAPLGGPGAPAPRAGGARRGAATAPAAAAARGTTTAPATVGRGGGAYTLPPGTVSTGGTGKDDPPAVQQLMADGWGAMSVTPNSIQADNGAGLTKGIVGLVNKGQPRKPDDWGSLRAWGWGASRALDYLETVKEVDSKKVGIEGVSRYGKGALVTMAFDERFAVVLIGSSGEGGARLHRRNFGESVESLAAPGEYHWMAGNFIKYGTLEGKNGPMNPGDMPVDSHDLIALCAPRLTFVSYGIPEEGENKWVDQHGAYMAAIAAQPVFRLLGAKDLGKSDDYLKEPMPPVNTALMEGHLAWRQHDGGHTDGPNWRFFLPWADRFFGRYYTPAPPRVVAAPAAANP